MMSSKDADKDDEASKNQKDILLEGAKKLILKTLCTRHSKTFWKDLPPEWKEDRDVILGGLQNNRIQLDDLPVELRNDRSFLIAAVSVNTKLWRLIPPSMNDDIDFARSLTAFTDVEAVEEIFKKYPVLYNERNTWIAYFSRRFGGEDYHRIIASRLPLAMRYDHELMVKACSRTADMSVGQNLIQNPDFLRDLLTIAPELLREISQDSQRAFPDLIIEFLPKALEEIYQRMDYRDHFYAGYFTPLALNIAEEVWNNRTTIQAWFQSGGPFIDHVHTALKGDKEVFLWLAKHFPKKFARTVGESFGRATESVRDDKQLMLKAIEFNPFIYDAASNTLKKDFDVCLAFLGNDQDPLKCLPRAEIRVLVKATWSRVEEELKNNENFVKTILCGMSSSLPRQSCSLVVFHQGEETEKFYKRLLAEYLGVPTGKRLRMLRNASKITTRYMPKKHPAKRKRTST